MEFNLKDRVKVVKSGDEDIDEQNSDMIGMTGTITKVDMDNEVYGIKWDSGDVTNSWSDESDIELLPKMKYHVGQEVVSRIDVNGLNGKKGKIFAITFSTSSPHYLVKIENWNKGHNGNDVDGIKSLGKSGYWFLENQIKEYEVPFMRGLDAMIKPMVKDDYSFVEFDIKPYMEEWLKTMECHFKDEHTLWLSSTPRSFSIGSEPNYFATLFKKTMDTLKSIPAKIKKILNESYRAFYKLGWIDEELDLTGAGKHHLNEFLLEKFEKEFGEFAINKVAEIETANKKKE